MDAMEDSASMINNSGTAPPPPFLNKTYDMVDDPSTNSVVSWSNSNNSFVVWNVPEFSRDLLPKYFKHNNFSSFVRQLNTYGFRKVDPDRWEFANEGFLRGQKHLLKTVSRRKPAHGHTNQQPPPPPPQVQSSQVGACVEVGNLELGEEVESLKRDKNILMQELVGLAQQQQETDHQLHIVGQRVQGMEQRQQQMMSFLAKTMHSGFLSQLVQHQNENNRRITGTTNKKRRLPRQEDEILVGKLGTKALNGQIVKYQPSMNEAAKDMLRQILKMNTSPRREPSMINRDAFLLDNVPSSNALDSGNTYNRTLGVTLSEVPPTSAECYMTEESGFPVSCHSTAISEIQSSPYPVTNCVKATQGLEENMHNFKEDTVVPELTPMQGIVPERTVEIPNANFMSSETGNAGYMDTSAVLDGTPTETDAFSPEPESDTLLDGVSNLPGITDIFWEQFLTTSPLTGETDEISLNSADGVTMDQELQLGKENGWNKTQNMNHLTEQMELLASGSQIG